MQTVKSVSVVFALLIVIAMCSSCKKNAANPALITKTVSLSGHQLSSYQIINNTKYLVVFESGLGDDASVWNQKNVPLAIVPGADVLLYDRAGYGKSPKGPTPRNINRLSNELDSVIAAVANSRKVILVGHSLGGMIIRDYAIKHPATTAALLFVDPSHELYNHPTPAQQDTIYNIFNTTYGPNFGGTMEASELTYDSKYLAALPPLPNIPVIVLTSMKTDNTHSPAERQLWYNAHEALKAGLTDFTHITTTNAGHYIMVEQPSLVTDNIKVLLTKLPK